MVGNLCFQMLFIVVQCMIKFPCEALGNIFILSRELNLKPCYVFKVFIFSKLTVMLASLFI